MPGPHRGSFCLLTWATINTSSIHYNLSVFILHHQKPQWASAWFDKQTKHEDLSEKPAGVGILEYYDTLGVAYSCLQLDFIVHYWALAQWHGLGMVLCAITDQQRCITEHNNKALWQSTSSAEPNVQCLWHALDSSCTNLLTLWRTRFELTF